MSPNGHFFESTKTMTCRANHLFASARANGYQTPVWVVLALSGLASCAPVPHLDHAAAHDLWGDRGALVFARDLDWCAGAVESRRSLVAGCLQRRGWSLRSVGEPAAAPF